MSESTTTVKLEDTTNPNMSRESQNRCLKRKLAAMLGLTEIRSSNSKDSKDSYNFIKQEPVQVRIKNKSTTIIRNMKLLIKNSYQK